MGIGADDAAMQLRAVPHGHALHEHALVQLDAGAQSAAGAEDAAFDRGAVSQARAGTDQGPPTHHSLVPQLHPIRY